MDKQSPILFYGADLNVYGYVLQDPIIRIDPNGLWSFSIGAYLGWGGGFTFGQNPSGSYFGTIRFGGGIGGGFGFDPQGTSPGGETCTGGMSAGTYAEASAHLGPFEGVYGMNHGYSQTRGPYYNPPKLTGGIVPSIGLGAGLSLGLEVSFY